MTQDDESNEVIIEPDAEIAPQSGHAKMPWFLLLVWTVNILFYIYYFVKNGIPDLQKWLGQ